MTARTVRGFTLLEIAVVLGLIGILSMLAVPTFTSFVKRSRELEAKTALFAISHAELRHHRDTGRFLACPPTPAEIPEAAPVAFDDSGPWRELGVSLAGGVWFSYRVDVDGDAYRVVARGDPDRDGVIDRWTLDGKTQVVLRDVEDGE